MIASALRRRRGSALATSTMAVASQALSTVEANGWTVDPSAGQVVSSSPVASSYQLQNMPEAS